jgi:hypothetical protein
MWLPNEDYRVGECAEASHGKVPYFAFNTYKVLYCQLFTQTLLRSGSRVFLHGTLRTQW